MFQNRMKHMKLNPKGETDAWVRRTSLRRNRSGEVAWGLVLSVLLLLSLLLPAVAGPVYPVKIGPSGRYLVDQNNVPFLIVGDSPQSLVVSLTEAQAQSYMMDRGPTNGFNSLLIDAICTSYTSPNTPANGQLLNGTQPFTNTISGGYYDLTTPNPAYFSYLDTVIKMAATNGLEVMLDPIETGGWLPAMLANGTNGCFIYGQYLGNRYKNFPNVIWASGNDYQDWESSANDSVVTAVALGIQSEDTNHLQTIELDYLASCSLDDPNWIPIVTLNWAYTYYPTYDEILHGYNQATNTPVFLGEANYEYETNSGTDGGSLPILRKQEYWTMLSGGVGQCYGNHYTWQFLSSWKTLLDSPGVTQLRIATSLFSSNAWYDLVPDTNHVFLTAGYGTYASTGEFTDNNYVTAAITPNGTLGMAYLPAGNIVTVNLAAMASAPIRAQWFDPGDGAYQAVSGSPFSNTGTNIFTPPGNNSSGYSDWVLVLTARLDVTKPTLKITAPTEGQYWSNPMFMVKGTANDNSAVTDVLYSLNGGLWISASTGNNWSNWTAAVDLTPGTNIFQAYALNSGGNMSLTNKVNFDFVVTNQLLVIINGRGTLSPDYTNAWLEVGRNYSIRATPGSGFMFSNWTSNLGWVSNTPSLNFMMESNLMLTANFVDVEKPTLRIAFPTQDRRWTNAALVANGIANDNVAVAYVLYSLNGSGWTNASTGNEWTNWMANVTLTPGTNTIEAYAVDTSGNVSATNKVSLLYLLPEPLTVQINGLWPAGGAAVVPGEASPNYKGMMLDVGVNYVMTARAEPGFAFTNWTGSWTTNSATLRFTMTTNLTFTANFVDVQKPTVSIVTPTLNEHLTNSGFTVSGKASDNVAVAGVHYSLNGSGWTNASTGNEWTNWFTPSLPLISGPNVVQAYAVDTSGNVSVTNRVNFDYEMTP
jgi:hypothetical protein